jgi:hypothetical protein
VQFNGNPPKELEYTTYLLLKYRNGGRISRLKNKVKKATRRYKGRTRTEIATELSHANDDYAHRYLNKLIEQDVLKQVGEKQTASNTVPTWEVDKKRLRQEFIDTEFFQEAAPVIAKTLEKEGMIGILSLDRIKD